MFYQYEDVNCADLVLSDTLFDSLITYKFVCVLISKRKLDL